jgi:glutamine amidotransferase-like uncharacterized protein
MKENHIYFLFYIFLLLNENCKSSIKGAPILLFNGTGTSTNDIEALKNILLVNHLNFVLANSAQLNDLDTTELRKYKLIIVPGGNFIDIGRSLTENTTSNIQKAVHQGLNYLGVCAGGFLAGDTRNNSFNIAQGVQFKFYSAEDKGIRKTSVTIINADGSKLDNYWEDGPQFSGWGEIISKYPDGTPATVEASFGSGWVVLTGVHPEAPESWRKEFHFSTSIENSHDYAGRLIKAALGKITMPHF